MPVSAAPKEPTDTGIGPYGVTVSIQRGSTASTIGPLRTEGPCSYGEIPALASIPCAAYDQPSRENNGGASTSGADQTRVA